MAYMGAVFIAQPWLALIPAIAFLLWYRLARRRLLGAVAVSWLLYAGYEYAIHRRWLCTGECNIRVDLLVIYPFLLLSSAAAIVAGASALSGRGAPRAGP